MEHASVTELRTLRSRARSERANAEAAAERARQARREEAAAEALEQAAIARGRAEAAAERAREVGDEVIRQAREAAAAAQTAQALVYEIAGVTAGAAQAQEEAQVSRREVLTLAQVERMRVECEELLDRAGAAVVREAASAEELEEPMHDVMSLAGEAAMIAAEAAKLAPQTGGRAEVAVREATSAAEAAEAIANLQQAAYMAHCWKAHGEALQAAREAGDPIAIAKFEERQAGTAKSVRHYADRARAFANRSRRAAANRAAHQAELLVRVIGA